ncbi:sulfatase family protein [Sphingobacterium sp. LRF_L2]|uniref:sulfatase family protein n=1 Tax=Sphingobacterium sp. LRF_L2 TaxID=3369421 RepID=UPI003F5E11A7
MKIIRQQKSSTFYLWYVVFIALEMTFSHSIIAQTSNKNNVGKGRATKPNIVIIMADDLDSKQLSCYGGVNMQTPHIDRLAKEGLKFNNLIASEAMCVPTRASLFTGLYPARHGAFQNHKPVYNDLKSVAHYLQALGYRVGLSGKDHVTKPAATFPFEIVPGFEKNCVATTDDYFLDSIAGFISQDREPYCLFVMSINPHAPWTVGDPDEFDPQKLVLPAHWVDTEITRKHFTKYLAEVRRLDNQVGDVLQLLESTGELDHTIVIFLGEQGAQFPGGKWNLYDNGQRSSMLIRWPKEIAKALETDAIVQYEDITPTLIALAGGSPIKTLDGKSFLPVIRNPAKSFRQYAFGIHNNRPEGPSYPIRSIRSDRYKLIWNLNADSNYYIKYMMNPNNTDLAYSSWLKKAETDDYAKFLTQRIAKRPTLEFYDLENDPYELKNLAEDTHYSKVIHGLRKELSAWMEEQGDLGVSMDVPLKKK